LFGVWFLAATPTNLFDPEKCRILRGGIVRSTAALAMRAAPSAWTYSDYGNC
jgi:hypothetical protein